MKDAKIFLNRAGCLVVKASALRLPLKDESVHAIVTSPPYWGIREYAGDQVMTWESGFQSPFGVEPHPDCAAWPASGCGRCYVCHSVEVLREMHRVLRPDGIVFWNLGDCYWRSDLLGKEKASQGAKLKYKDLVLSPYRVALAAQADGWWVRSIVIWEKSNPVPRAVQGRPKEVHDHIIILSKSARPYWDEEAFSQPGPGFDPLRPKTITTVWRFPTQRYAGSHFATFPEELPTRCILAATSEHGCCPACGAPWQRIVDVQYEVMSSQSQSSKRPLAKQQAQVFAGHEVRKRRIATTSGWRPGCECNAGVPIPATVLDPFGGSGTTAVAAIGLRRRFVLADVAYQDLQLERIGPRLEEWERLVAPKLGDIEK